MCISWTRKGLISLMHGVTMKSISIPLMVTRSQNTGVFYGWKHYQKKLSVIYQSLSAMSSTRKIPVRGKESILTFKRDRQRKYKRDIEERSRNHYCRGKAVIVTQFECVCVCLRGSTYPPLYCHL